MHSTQKSKCTAGSSGQWLLPERFSGCTASSAAAATECPSCSGTHTTSSSAQKGQLPLPPPPPLLLGRRFQLHHVVQQPVYLYSLCTTDQSLGIWASCTDCCMLLSMVSRPAHTPQTIRDIRCQACVYSTRPSADGSMQTMASHH